MNDIMKSVYIKIANLVFSINITDAVSQKIALPRNFIPFIVSGKIEQEFIFDVDIDSNQLFPQPEKKITDFDAEGFQQEIFSLNDGGYLFKFYGDKRQYLCSFTATPDFKKIKVAMDGDLTLSDYAINNILMISFSFATVKYGILMMHSSVIKYRDKAYMFLGVSGTGKSTHSRLWLKNFEGAILLNDDNPVVRYTMQDGVICYGSPWSGKTPCYKNDSAKVGALVMLKQAPYNKIKRQSTLEAFASFMVSCGIMMWDKLSYNNICENISNVISNVPVYGLECLPDDAAAKICKEEVIQNG